MNTRNGYVSSREAGSLVSDLRREMARFFDDWTSPVGRGMQTDYAFVPACDVEESEAHYLLTLEMAGVRKDDIKLEVSNNDLTISGERHQECERKEEGRWYTERRFGKFQRNFSFPPGIDPIRAEANYEDGILRVLLPKAESAKARQIKISSGGAGVLGKLLGSLKARNGSEKEDPHSSGEYQKEKMAS